MEKRFGVRRERFVLCSSHSHATPCLDGALVNMFGYKLPDEQIAAIKKYTAELVEKLEKVCVEAVGDRKPAKLMWGEGEAKVAVNRRNKGGAVGWAMAMIALGDEAG